MARFRGSPDDAGEEAVDISPLIDCVFILLIFFIVSTTFVDESGIRASVSQPSAPSEVDKEVIVIMLNKSGDAKIGDDRIGFGGIQSRVQALLREEDAPVIIQPHVDTPVDALVRARDAVVLAGAEKVSYGKPHTRDRS